jgi:hypothetical protein
VDWQERHCVELVPLQVRQVESQGLQVLSLESPNYPEPQELTQFDGVWRKNPVLQALQSAEVAPEQVVQLELQGWQVT